LIWQNKYQTDNQPITSFKSVQYSNGQPSTYSSTGSLIAVYPLIPSGSIVYFEMPTGIPNSNQGGYSQLCLFVNFPFNFNLILTRKNQ
jgi:hypothetical protein